MSDPGKVCRALDESNLELTAGLQGLVQDEKKALALLIARLAEFDRRKLYADLGHSSLYAYCIRALGYSEAEATWRIHTARIARRFPILLSLLESGQVHMPAVMVLSAHLTEANHQELLKQAQGKTRREVEELSAALAPQTGRSDYAARRGPETIQPFAAQRVRIGFDTGKGFLQKLERARQLLRHKYPAGRLENVFDEVMEAFLDKKDPDRRLRAKGLKKDILAQTAPALPPLPGPEPTPEIRRIPQSVQDEVWRRDEGRCTFLGPEGARCPERGGLEFDHIIPWALGGPSNNARNIRLLCRTHNQLFARRVFGDAARALDGRRLKP